MSNTHVAIIGAGPYGLSVAAHLRAANVETKVFGTAMEFWQQQTPKGMLLVSTYGTSHIADPYRRLSLDDFHAAAGSAAASPVPREDFISYGLWYARHAVPDLDRRRVARVEKTARGFQLLLEDGECVGTDRVIVATGLAPFVRVPREFAGLPPELVSHTAHHNDLGDFGGREVLVVGAGQSAAISAILMHEAGASVELAVRGPEFHWAERRAYHRLGRLKWLAYAPSEVGPAGLSWLVGLPGVFNVLPRDLQTRAARRSTRPAGAGWLRPRADSIRISPAHSVASARPLRDRLHVRFQNGEERVVDHALLATGYAIDVTRLGFLAPSITDGIERIGGYPKLSRGFESTVPGLHFAGAAGTASFGPVMKFVVGTGYTARAIARRVRADAPVPVSAVSGVAQYG